jgi:transcriptional regulator with XRE-family HTH domain
MTPEEHWERIRGGIRHLREDRGLSKRALAQRAGVDHSTITRIENGSTPDTMTLLKVLHALGLDIRLVRRLL